MERSWEIFKSAIHAASTNVIDYRKMKNQDWFDNNCTRIHKLLEEKKSAHDAYLACPQSAILKAIFQTLGSTVKIKLKQIENDWWLQKAAEVQGFADTNNSHQFYVAVKAIYGPQRKKKLAPVKSSDGTLIRGNNQIVGR